MSTSLHCKTYCKLFSHFYRILESHFLEQYQKIESIIMVEDDFHYKVGLGIITRVRLWLHVLTLSGTVNTQTLPHHTVSIPWSSV